MRRWGPAFKPNTDDMREAPSRVLIAELARRGATYASSATAALEGANALIIITERKEFRTPDFGGMAQALKDKLVFDGRNLYEPALIPRARPGPPARAKRAAKLQQFLHPTPPSSPPPLGFRLISIKV